MPYINFTDEQKLRAANVDLEQFLIRQGEELVYRHREIRLKANHSVSIRGNEWYDFATRKGGGPISFVKNFYGLSYPEAISCLLGGETGIEYQPASPKKAEPPKILEQPAAHKDARQVFGYLVNAGYILMTHSLILRDVDAFVVWDDDSDNDGVRPPAIDLQLCVNDTPVEGSEMSVTLSGAGDTWFYRFRDVQKYKTPSESEEAVEIPYNITVVKPSGYTVSYNNYTAILHHDKELVKRTVEVEWQDSNNQDGKRPASMMVQLYADNVPLEGKTMTLSDANGWTHTWDELPL